MSKVRKYFTKLVNEHSYFDVIPMKTGIQTVKELDARLRISGMIDKILCLPLTHYEAFIWED